MKTEILSKLEALLETDDIFAIQHEFKQLAAQFKSVIDHAEETSVEDEMDHEDDDKDETVRIEPAADVKDKADTEGDTAVEQVEEKSVKQDAPKPESDVPESATDIEEATPETSAEAKSETVSEKKDEPAQTEEGNAPEEKAVVEKPESVAESTEKSESGTEEKTDTAIDDIASESYADAKAHYAALVEKFKQRLKKARDEKKRLEEETIKTAKDLLEELQKLVENEENIGKAFNGFNAIQEKWKSLPRVSNDAYRDLNIEYNKYAEKFFYNINIYKELKELDLKHNLELKQQVIADQKKLAELNDIRLMEVEVRLNQDRWNEIGPTFKEEWDKIKDEFWTVTREIYRKIQDFYNERREQQQKNLEQKQKLLSQLNQILTLDLKSHKKWQKKTNEVIELQKQWKMIGYVPKENAQIWKDFKKGCDRFFENKRSYHKELYEAQDANRDAKQQLLDEAEALKDSEDWKETSHRLINLQKEWKKIGAARQRDENRLWRRFRQACDTFFKRRKGQQAEENTQQKENLIAKQALLKELEAFEPGNDSKENVDTLKGFSEKWRAIGHVPYKSKDEVNKTYKKLLDSKFSALKINREQKDKIRFEQKLENIRDKENNSQLIRKEQESIRAKISKLKGERIQLENNMGFFANSKGANKYKDEVERKISKIENEIRVLKDRLSLLREA